MIENKGGDDVEKGVFFFVLVLGMDVHEDDGWGR